MVLFLINRESILRGVSSKHTKILFADFIVFILCLFGIYGIANKADLPFKIKTENDEIVAYNAADERNIIKTGSVIYSIEQYEVKSKEEVEILLDAKVPGGKLDVSFLVDGKLLTKKTELVNYYSLLYILIAVIVGSAFFLVAIFVLLKCENYNLGKTLHWSFVFTSMIILMTWGNFSSLPLGLGKITRAGFHLGYLFAPLYFLKFSIIFPAHIKFNVKKAVPFLAVTALVLFVLVNTAFFRYTESIQINSLRSYILIFDICSIFIVLLTLAAIFIFIHTYITTGVETDRKKLRWIILGFLIGPLTYMLFWVVPSRLWNSPLLPEEIVLLLVAFVPITFGIAIIKYRLMNIDLIFRRSLVYTTVISFLLLIYIGIVSLAAKLINNPDSEISSIIGAILIAIIFQPAKSKVQKFVDKKFFRISYDYRSALNKFISNTKNLFSEEELFNKAVELIDNVIPVSNIGIFKFDNKKKELTLLASKYFESKNKSAEVHIQETQLPGSLPVSNLKNVEPGVKIDEEKFSCYEQISPAIIIGITSSKYGVHAILSLGNKRSDRKYTQEDIDLVKIITGRLSLKLDQVKLQEEVIKEHLETERLEELNKLKSFFVSSVSHDLKTPLTSIKLFAERLRSSKNLTEEKINEYLEIIEGESDRLTRLINNVLDYSKIERGALQLNFREVDLVELCKNVLSGLEYQFKMNRFNVELNASDEEIMIFGDYYALSEVLVNLIMNSIKYSHADKNIELSIRQKNDYAVIDVVDCGEGISEEDISNIFEPFFRVKDEKISKTGGAGLGLAIVKHIMDDHKGKVTVESKLGEGSKFSLFFPLADKNEKDINN